MRNNPYEYIIITQMWMPSLTLKSSVGLSLLSSALSMGYIFHDRLHTAHVNNARINHAMNPVAAPIRTFHTMEQYELFMEWCPPQ